MKFSCKLNWQMTNEKNVIEHLLLLIFLLSFRWCWEVQRFTHALPLNTHCYFIHASSHLNVGCGHALYAEPWRLTIIITLCQCRSFPFLSCTHRTCTRTCLPQYNQNTADLVRKTTFANGNWEMHLSMANVHANEVYSEFVRLLFYCSARESMRYQIKSPG